MKTRVIAIAMGVLLTAATLAGAATSSIRNSAASGHENITEQTLVLENWMVNESYWKCIGNDCLRRDYDEALTLDIWMTTQTNWDYAVLLPVETEKSLEMESWMTNESLWETGQFPGVSETEESVQIKSRAADPVSWACALNVPVELEKWISLESWMTDDHVWSNEFSQMVFIPCKK